MRADVAIVGAGAAGLAAARTLDRMGKSVIVLEARDRLGGRARTIHPAACATPVELGAEFIHGRPAAMLELLREARILDIDVGEDVRWEYRDGRLVRAEDPFSPGDLLDRVKELKEDESVEAFLRRFAGDPGRAQAVENMRALVQGFDAADPARAGIFAIAEEWEGGSSIEAGASRPVGGYGALFEALAASLDPARVRLLLQTVAQTIRWGRDGVTIAATRFGEPVTIEARAAILTVPVGVLQRAAEEPGALAFEPALPAAMRVAIDAIAMGPVVKVVLIYREPFWDERGFFHAPGAVFPTVWTTMPTHAPVLTAWAGGSAVDRFAGLDHDAIVRLAIEHAATIFDAPETARETLVSAHAHDWRADPFAYGAYSYVTVGANAARETLATPVDSSLLFAGEACGTNGDSGTVGSAIDSGIRAARAIARS